MLECWFIYIHIYFLLLSLTSEDLLMTWFTYSDGFISNLEWKQSHDVAAAACCDVSAYPGSLEIALIILYRLLKDYVVYFTLSSLSLLLYNTYMVAPPQAVGGECVGEV